MLKMYSPCYEAAMNADQDRTQRMPFFMSMPAMCMGMAAATSVILLETGVVTSVSFFVVVITLLLALLLLVGLVVLISLLLTCLTRLVRLESLVGLTIQLATSNIQATRGV
jgi:hypothetical protein